MALLAKQRNPNASWISNPPHCLKLILEREKARVQRGNWNGALRVSDFSQVPHRSLTSLDLDLSLNPSALASSSLPEV